jgi:hypothetical protein
MDGLGQRRAGDDAPGAALREGAVSHPTGTQAGAQAPHRIAPSWWAAARRAWRLSPVSATVSAGVGANTPVPILSQCHTAVSGVGAVLCAELAGRG